MEIILCSKILNVLKKKKSLSLKKPKNCFQYSGCEEPFVNIQGQGLRLWNSYSFFTTQMYPSKQFETCIQGSKINLWPVILQEGQEAQREPKGIMYLTSV
jgi:hypothetical protein